MSNRELCVSMLDSFTESQLGNVATMLQTMKKAIEDAMSGDVPNDETAEAMTEVDAMIASGTGEHFTGTTADFFQQLAEG